MNKEVRRRLKSITDILIFLVVMTAFWYGPRQNLANNVAANISDYYMNKTISVNSKSDLELNNKEVDYVVTNKTDSEQNYEIIITTDHKKQRKSNCQLIPNNYLKYSLKIDDNYIEEKNLSVEGVIYTGVLKPHEEKNFSIKIVLDKENLQKDECYYPVVKAATYNKI